MPPKIARWTYCVIYSSAIFVFGFWPSPFIGLLLKLPNPCFVSTNKMRTPPSDSGSYDESVRIWDARTMREPVSCTPTGGGVWRLKWHPDPDRGNLLLAACMHAGMRVLDTGMGMSDPLGRGSQSSLARNGELEVPKGIVTKYTRHASMAYGADWCLLPTMLRSHRAVIASCSFYDSLFCLWQTPPLWAQ